MSTRYKIDKEFINNSSLYSEIFESKNVNNIKSYKMTSYNNLDDSKYDVIYHYVTPFDKLYNISDRYYKTPEYWWVIGIINNIKSDFDLQAGTYIKILNPLSSVLNQVIK